MKNALAKRYAKALIEIARDENAYDQYGRELRSALGVFTGSPELTKFLLNPMYKLDERIALMDKVSESIALSPYVVKFFRVLVQTRKISILPEIVDAYSWLEDEYTGRLRVFVESPVDLDPSVFDDIKNKVAATIGKNIVICYEKKPELLGGLVLRIENTVFDGSLKTQLQLVKEKILGGVL